MPVNRRIYDLVISKGDLLIDGKMPDVLLQLCAHISAYEAVLAQWERGNYDIRVKAKDINENESPWSDPLSIAMPQNNLKLNQKTIIENLIYFFFNILYKY